MRMVSVVAAKRKYRQKGYLDAVCDSAEINTLCDAGFTVKYNARGDVAYIVELER